MKKVAFLILCALVLSISCKKDTEESIDCVIELVFATISHSVNPNDSKELTFTVDYAGNFTITIEWIYGDGTSATKTGTTTTHIYTTAGNYEVKANITLSGENYSSCSTSKSKFVDVN